GGVSNFCATLKVINSTLSGSTADEGTVGGKGGGVYGIGGPLVSLTGCTLSNNSATGAGGAGGGICFYGPAMTVSGCTLSGNWAGGGSEWGWEGVGGGVLN